MYLSRYAKQLDGFSRTLVFCQLDRWLTCLDDAMKTTAPRIGGKERHSTGRLKWPTLPPSNQQIRLSTESKTTILVLRPKTCKEIFSASFRFSIMKLSPTRRTGVFAIPLCFNSAICHATLTSIFKDTESHHSQVPSQESKVNILGASNGPSTDWTDIHYLDTSHHNLRLDPSLTLNTNTIHC